MQRALYLWVLLQIDLEGSIGYSRSSTGIGDRDADSRRVVGWKL